MSSAATHGRTPVCGPLQRGVRRLAVNGAPDLPSDRIGSGTLLLVIVRLVELHVEATRHSEVSRNAVAEVLGCVYELDALGTQLGDCRVEVVAVEGDVRQIGRAHV